MDINKLDEKLKASINRKYDKVPEKIDKNIDNTLNNLKRKRGNKKILKMIASVAIIVLVGSFTMIGVTAASVGIQSKDLIFQIFGLGKGYEEYASDLNISKKSNGINITITSAVYDGYKLCLGYKIESDSEVGENVLNQIRIGGSITSEGKKFVNTWYSSDTFINNKSKMGYIIFNIDRSEGFLAKVLGFKDIKLLDTITFQLESLAEINGVEYKWNFDIPISSKIAKENIEEFEVNEYVGSNKIKKIIKTPLGIYVELIIDRDNQLENGFILTDDKGRELYCKGGNGGTIENYGFKNKTELVTTEYLNSYKDIEGFRIIPFEYLNSNEDDIKNISISIKGNNFSINSSDGLEIVEVKREKEETKIYFKSKYPISTRLNLDGIGELKAKTNEVGVLTIPEILKDGKYELTYYDVYSEFKIYEENVIKVSK